MYLAHRTEEGREQPLLDHLNGTAKLASAFAAAFGQEKLAEVLGMAHDIGKYSDAFQRYLRANGQGSRVDHATAGAKVLMRRGMLAAAFCAAGHHTGLPDGGARGDLPDSGTMWGRLKKEIADFRAWQQEVTLPDGVQEPKAHNGFEQSFFTRMLFSCLVDADFLNTEAFMTERPAVLRGNYDTMETLFKRLKSYIAPWLRPTQNALNAKRSEILRTCLEMGKKSQGLFTLTVPTGGGKTVSSLAFALQHAVENGLERVIYVIPYTSIVEQTADTFRKILGAENVLAHYANADFNQKTDEDPQAERQRLAAENWDIPIVVTTNVQFFESLFANKTSRCRKLHNIAKSVVIFDEAQMLPLPYLRPCVRAIGELVQRYHLTAVLCTATQPALEPYFAEIGVQAREICPDTEALYRFFRRTTLSYIGPCTQQMLAQKMEAQSQALAIVATRKQAAALFSMLPEEGRFHLSTLMAPVHRTRILETIRRRLKEGKPCRVAATSLVEAGVDVDFPLVFRAEAGLDSIIQAAGRCNREGKRAAADSMVYIYQPEDPPPILVKQQVELFRETRERFADLAAPEAIHAYFDAVHALGEQGGQLDSKQILRAFDRGRNGSQLPFAQVAQDFKLIQTETRSVLIPLEEEAANLAQALRSGAYSRGLFRRAGAYTVSIYPQHFQALVAAGDVEVVADGFGVLVNDSLYSEDTGLSLQADEGKAIFI